jgi:hypothetical protein
MVNPTFTIRARVWKWNGEGPWHMLTVGKQAAEEIRRAYMWPLRGFGSIPIHAKIGSTRWKTSLFREKGGTFVLLLNKNVRAQERIGAGDTVTVLVEVVN